jgi:hypothetical protein
MRLANSQTILVSDTGYWLTVTALSMWSAISDERVGLSVVSCQLMSAVISPLSQSQCIYILHVRYVLIYVKYIKDRT